MMQKRIISTALALFSAAASAQVYVAPHVDRQGNYRQGHMRSAPDGNPYNNYSSQGNVNPYTGQPGTRNPYQQAQPQVDPYAFQRGAGAMPLPPPPGGQVDPYAFQRGYRGY